MVSLAGLISCHTFGRFKATGVQSIDMTIMAHNTFGTTLLFYCFYAGQIDYRR